MIIQSRCLTGIQSSAAPANMVPNTFAMLTCCQGSVSSPPCCSLLGRQMAAPLLCVLLIVLLFPIIPLLVTDCLVFPSLSVA
uniref:Uncharacterized protein n=1 Tax=Anguilla anguilla TaxID=7936 RepID=A0A0E9W6Q5_ANGAN